MGGSGVGRPAVSTEEVEPSPDLLSGIGVGVPTTNPDSLLPQYADLTEDAQRTLQRVYSQLGSLYDNITHGEPHFQEHVPSFDDDRWTSLLWNAVGRVNVVKDPKTFYDEASYPYTDALAGYAVYLMLLVEAITHFIITYTEEPDTDNLASAPFLSRRDYWERWKQTLELIKADAVAAAEAYKHELLMTSYGFGTAHVIIGGRHVPYGYTPKVRPSSRYAWGWY